MTPLLPGFSFEQWFPALEARFLEAQGWIWPVVALVSGLLLAGFVMDRLADLVAELWRSDDDD